MKRTEVDVRGAFVVSMIWKTDERGGFARNFDAAQFEAWGLDPRVAQCSTSRNRRRGTLRGLHYQAAPHEEAKLVRCTRGAIFDVVLDLRPSSSTYLRWAAVELEAAGDDLLYVPPGVAHGFLTLTEDAEVSYQISTPQVESSARGVRWDDPAFGIAWPAQPEVISDRDARYPDFVP